MPKKRVVPKTKKDLSAVQLTYLTDTPGNNLDAWESLELTDLRAGCAPAKKLWEQYKTEFLPEFIKRHPGQRPQAWWDWDCPRQADKDIGCCWHGTLPEPRLQVAGGPFEVSGVPCFTRGVSLYNEYDVENPPVFESQAAFLQRHGLLTPMEIKKLKPSDYKKSEPITDILG